MWWLCIARWRSLQSRWPRRAAKKQMTWRFGPMWSSRSGSGAAATDGLAVASCTVVDSAGPPLLLPWVLDYLVAFSLGYNPYGKLLGYLTSSSTRSVVSRSWSLCVPPSCGLVRNCPVLVDVMLLLICLLECQMARALCTFVIHCLLCDLNVWTRVQTMGTFLTLLLINSQLIWFFRTSLSFMIWYKIICFSSILGTIS
jgi:hypothetical protein